MGNSTLPDVIAALGSAVSIERLRSYRPPEDGSDESMIVTYLWNIALCEALYTPLNALEVTLRNAIHSGLSQRFGTEAWYDHPECLEFRQQHAIIDAKIGIAGTNKAKQPTPGRVVASLSFGFWTTLLNRPYEGKLWAPERYALLHQVFPHVPRHLRTRDKIHQHYDMIRRLRNRVFHFEPIWNDPILNANHQQIIDAIGWISPILRDLTILNDRFPEAYEHGKERIERSLRNYLKA